MKARIELSLRTREVYQLFERRISGDRLFIAAILHKFNKVVCQCHSHEEKALEIYSQMQKKLLSITEQFNEEMTRFETILSKLQYFENKKVSFGIEFRPTIMVNNPLAAQLIQFIETYDKLIATLKLLQLAGCFSSKNISFENIRRYQKMSNQVLSSLLLATTKLSPINTMKLTQIQGV